MRFRSRFKLEPASLMWIALALCEIALECVRIHKKLAANEMGWVTASVISLAAWTLILTFNFVQSTFGYWEVDASSIRYRRFWKISELPVSSIAAIRPETSSERSPKAIEIEIARLGPSIYPHSYLIASPADREGFMQAVQINAPQLSPTHR
jgi:hypothetical protein